MRLTIREMITIRACTELLAGVVIMNAPAVVLACRTAAERGVSKHQSLWLLFRVITGILRSQVGLY